MNNKQILIAALLAGAFSPAMASLAESADDKGAAPVRTRIVMSDRFVVNGGDTSGPPSGDHVIFTGPMMIMDARKVKNAPYSAEVVFERIQNLADGNQIVEKTSSLSYRDSAGRTRYETRNASGTVTRIAINDLPTGIAYHLNPETRIATKLVPYPRPVHATGDKAGAPADEMRKASGAIILERVGSGHGDIGQRVSENVRNQIIKQAAQGHPMPGKDSLGPFLAGAFGDMKWSNKATTKDLGSKDIEGVKALGKLRSYEIPAGEIGNRNAIVVANETWTSPELKVTLLAKASDPRTGENIYRLDNLKREEPAASLFVVPSDYTIKDGMTAGPKAVEEKK